MAKVEFGNANVQYAQGDLNGVPIATALPPDEWPRATIFCDVNTGAIYQNARVAGVAKWVILNGGRGGSSLPYLVGPVSSPALFTSIQDAIDTAVAEGHDGADPAAITVLPGLFVEDLTLYDGIYVFGLAGGASRDVILTDDRILLYGDVTVALPDGGVCGIDGMVVQGSVLFGGAAQQLCVLRDVVVRATASVAVACSNSVADSELVLDHVTITTTASGASAYAFRNTGARLRVAGYRVALETGAYGDPHAVGVRDDIFVLSDSYSGGPFVVTDAGLLVLTQCSVYCGATPAITATGAPGDPAVVELTNCTVSSYGTPTFDGADAELYLLSSTVTPYGAALTIGAGLTLGASRVVRLYTRAVVTGAGPHAFDQTTDSLFVATPPGGAAVVLSDPTTVPDGTRQTVKSTTATGSMTVTVAGGGTIDGAASHVVVAGTTGRSAATYELADGAWTVHSLAIS